MPCIKALFLASLHFAANLIPTTTTVSTIPQPDHTRLQQTELPQIDDLKKVLDSIPSSVLHEALHSSIPHFADGMFEHDGSAVAEVYRTNQPLATRLLAAARYDLLRRQNGNLTATNPPPAVTTSAVPTINSEGVAVITSTNDAGSTIVTTITPTGGVVSSIVLQTTTLPDGSRSTYTSFAAVTATGVNAPKLQGAAVTLNPRAVTLSGLFVAMVAFGALLL